MHRIVGLDGVEIPCPGHAPDELPNSPFCFFSCVFGAHPSGLEEKARIERGRMMDSDDAWNAWIGNLAISYPSDGSGCIEIAVHVMILRAARPS